MADAIMNWCMQIIKESGLWLMHAAIAIGVAVFFYYTTYSIFGLEIALYTMIALATVLLGVALYTRTSTAGYARAWVAIQLLVVAWLTFTIVLPIPDVQRAFYTTLAVAALCGAVALIFKSLFIAGQMVIIALCAPALLYGSVDIATIGWYLVAILAVIVAFAYLTQWRYLAVLAFVIYLAYHQYLFAAISMVPKKGMLLFDDALWILGFIGAIFTIIPWLYSLVAPGLRTADVLCVVGSGAYTFATIRMIIRDQLRLVEQFAFLRTITASPKYIDILLYLFLLYAVIYATLFVVGKLIRRSSALSTVMLMLSVISGIGAVAVMNRSQKIVYTIGQTVSSFLKQVPLLLSKIIKR